MGYTKSRDTPIRDNWKCILICLAMSMANCQYGYDTATVAGFQVSSTMGRKRRGVAAPAPTARDGWRSLAPSLDLWWLTLGIYG